MKRFFEGEDRSQSKLFPERLDDYVAEDNPVKVIEVFVDELNLNELGFDGMQPEATGRPAYHPSTLLKIYLYGYLNRIQSSRRLEREAQRNVELMWLTGRLMPDFKTIADFRKDNGTAIRTVCRQFIVLCRQLNLFTQAVVAIDGSKFKAVNNRDKNYTGHKVKKRMEQVEDSIGRYLDALDRADRKTVACSRSEVVPAEGEDRCRQGANAAPEGYWRAVARSARPAGLADRSGRPLDGDQWQRHRHGRIQCPIRGRCQASSDRRP